MMPICVLVIQLMKRKHMLVSKKKERNLYMRQSVLVTFDVQNLPADCGYSADNLYFVKYLL